jgi:methionyl-tRNA formyltransferase
MKVAFFGTPQFAVPALEKLLNSKHRIVCVVTQPDKSAGRGKPVTAPPVKQFAVKHNIPVLQPEKISRDVTQLKSYGPDIIVTCAFGQILRQSVLDAAPHGVINVHGSLLPKYRGAAPIQWAVINGEKITGVTIAQTELGLDCGAIIEQTETEIGGTETAGELFNRLSLLGADLLLTALDKIESGTATFIPQDESAVTLAPMLDKNMARIDWAKSAAEISNLVRGLNPWPMAYFMLNDAAVRVLRAAEVQTTSFDTPAVQNTAGAVVHASGKFGLFVQCGDGIVKIEELQFPNKKAMSAAECLNGKSIAVGTVLD